MIGRRITRMMMVGVHVQRHWFSHRIHPWCRMIVSQHWDVPPVTPSPPGLWHLHVLNVGEGVVLVSLWRRFSGRNDCVSDLTGPPGWRRNVLVWSCKLSAVFICPGVEQRHS